MIEYISNSFQLISTHDKTSLHEHSQIERPNVCISFIYVQIVVNSTICTATSEFRVSYEFSTLISLDYELLTVWIELPTVWFELSGLNHQLSGLKQVEGLIPHSTVSNKLYT